MLTPFLTRFSSCADKSKQYNVYNFLKSFGFNGGSTPKTFHTDSYIMYASKTLECCAFRVTESKGYLDWFSFTCKDVI